MRDKVSVRHLCEQRQEPRLGGDADDPKLLQNEKIATDRMDHASNRAVKAAAVHGEAARGVACDGPVKKPCDDKTILTVEFELGANRLVGKHGREQAVNR
eukprot:Amastigsp_a678818_9.p5 type:complete len:100 gc:universal Amastigsp_a678818_9:934-1233(+)